MEKKQIGPIDIADQLERIKHLLFDVEPTISTTPALTMLYGIVVLELNYLKIRLSQDKKLLENATIFSSEPGGFRINYKEWHDVLESARWKWGYKNFSMTDPVCYESPGFDYSIFNEKHEDLWKKLHIELDETLQLLLDLHGLINFPSDEKIIQTYDLLQDSYMKHEYDKDKESFIQFMLSVPKRRDLRIQKLQNKLDEYTWQLKQSGVLDELCCEIYVSDEKLAELESLGSYAVLDYQRKGVLKMLYDEKKQEWDKDAIGRYFFTNRTTISRDQRHSFFRYLWQKESIEKELSELGISCKSKETTAEKDETTSSMDQTLIYVSYPWMDKDLMDTICKNLENNNLKYKRDIKDCGYRQNISNFEEQIANANIVIAIINDNSLHSIDCMYEMCQLTAKGNIEQRLFPIVDLPHNKKRDSSLGEDYFKLWQSTFDEKKKKLFESQNNNNELLIEEIKYCNRITSEFGRFWSYICRTNTLTKEMLVDDNCKILVNEIIKHTKV